eukprot:5784061-Ditylum_brightwellii.AAC.1
MSNQNPSQSSYHTARYEYYMDPVNQEPEDIATPFKHHDEQAVEEFLATMPNLLLHSSFPTITETEPTVNGSPNEGSFLPQSHAPTLPGDFSMVNQDFSAPATIKGCEDLTNSILPLTVPVINVNDSANEGSFLPQSQALSPIVGNVSKESADEVDKAKEDSAAQNNESYNEEEEASNQQKTPKGCHGCPKQPNKLLITMTGILTSTTL